MVNLESIVRNDAVLVIPVSIGVESLIISEYAGRKGNFDVALTSAYIGIAVALVGLGLSIYNLYKHH